MSLSPARIWWTAAEIADAQLPCMPTTKRKINEMIDRENWRARAGLARRREGRGGGWEYHWHLLPGVAQKKLLAQAAKAVPSTPAKPTGLTPDRAEAWAWFEALPDAVQAKARARLAVIQAAEALRDGGATMQVAVHIAASQADVSPRSVWNWVSMTATLTAIVQGHKQSQIDDLLPWHYPATV